MRISVVALILVGSSGIAAAQRWQDATAECLGTTAQWTNKVEVADVDGDGLVDILLANGGNYDDPGQPEASRVWKNTGGWETPGSHCMEISAQAVGGVTGLSRVIKVADVDGDGDPDIVFGGAYQTQLRLFLRDGNGWTDGTLRLPQQPTSAGDLEFGDVDGDGDLDMLIGDWGANDPTPGSPGGRTRLYLNDGAGNFTDATATAMPDLLVKFSWDVELVDVDNDWDLDALVSCKYCDRQLLYRNDGTGTFTDDPDALPQSTNNYDFEPMDIDGDGDLDLATINNGGNLRDTLLLNDGTGRFTDASDRLEVNPQADDNVAVWLDVDSDGDADLLIGRLVGGPDRLLLNDGTGNFTGTTNATPNDTAFSLGMAIADLDGDGRLDLVQGQGEGNDDSDKVQLATAEVAVDTAQPVVRFEVIGPKVFARVHDHQSPSRAHDWQRVFAETATGDVELAWYGEYLWTATAAAVTRVCAVDRQGNMGCSEGAPAGDGMPGGDAGLPPIDQSSGCCDSGGSPATSALYALAFAALVGCRRRRRQCQKPIARPMLR